MYIHSAFDARGNLHHLLTSQSVSMLCIPFSSAAMILSLDCWNTLSSVVSQKNLTLGLMTYAQKTCLTSPNQVLAEVKLVGVGKSFIADNIVSDGLTPSIVTVKPANSAISQQN